MEVWPVSEKRTALFQNKYTLLSNYVPTVPASFYSAFVSGNEPGRSV